MFDFLFPSRISVDMVSSGYEKYIKQPPGDNTVRQIFCSDIKKKYFPSKIFPIQNDGIFILSLRNSDYQLIVTEVPPINTNAFQIVPFSDISLCFQTNL